uniref:GDSL esterase/lipase n=1 Tax=Zea mays TaxID=4577 RepID=A0A804LZ06_MAIZE
MPTLYKHTDPAWRCSCMTSARLFTCCCSRDRPSPTTRMRASSSSSLLLLLAAAAVGVLLQARPSECARAFFVFGDSLVDNGNNNYLMTTARADSPPYGIDYPTHRPTGRFSNGKNIPDIISTRAPRRRAHAAVPEPRAPRPEAAGRRQLRVGRRRDPQRHRLPVRGHHPDEPPAALLRRVPGQAKRAGGRGAGAPARAPLARAHHARRQRLRQQLLPRPLLPALPPVRAAGIRRLHRLRVQEDPHPPVRHGLPPRAGDGHGASGVRAGDPCAAQPQRRVRGGADARGGALQPAAGARPGPAQRALWRRHLHRGQRLPRPLRLRQRPGRLRLRHGQGRVLRTGPPQRPGPLHPALQPVRRPQQVRLLGRLPPHGARQPGHRQPVHVRLARLRQPHEPQHRLANGRRI